jgi:hypothetical protein
MASKDGFRLDHAEESAQRDSAKAWRREMIKPAIVGATAAAIALAFVSVENPSAFLNPGALLTNANPSALLTNATAFVVSLLPQDGKVEQVPIVRSGTEIQSSAGIQTDVAAQASSSTASEQTTSDAAASGAPTNGNIPVKTAEQGQTETGPSAEEWLGRFQAWAAHDPAQPETQPATTQPATAQGATPAAAQPAPAQPVQETQAKPASDPVKTAVRVQDARAEIEPVKSHRSVRHVKHARAELKDREERKQARHHARLVRREQSARLLVRPQDAQDQEQPVEPPRQPTFLESLGIHQ